jgi:hypothetical protein
MEQAFCPPIPEGEFLWKAQDGVELDGELRLQLVPPFP